MACEYNKGIYNAECTEAGTGVAKTGNPQVILKVRMMSQLDPSEPDAVYECPQRERTLWLTVTDNTQDRVLKNLRDAGWHGSAFDDIGQMVGNRFRVECQHEVNQAGQLHEKWEFPRGESPPLVVDANVNRKLNALFGSKLKEGAKPPLPRTPLTRASNPEQPTGEPVDEIPF